VDAVAVAMITPGPVVITAAFIGYLVAGPIGAFVAAWAVFAPPYFVVIIAAPVLPAVRSEPASEGFRPGRHGGSSRRNRRSRIHPRASFLWLICQRCSSGLLPSHPDAYEEDP